MTSLPEESPKAYVIKRHERSPIEFHGQLLVEQDGWLSEACGPRYCIRVYKEASSNFVLEVVVVDGDAVLWQMADFADSVEEVDDLLCLIHDDVMENLADLDEINKQDLKLLDKRLESELDHQSVRIMQQLNEMAAGPTV